MMHAFSYENGTEGSRFDAFAFVFFLYEAASVQVDFSDSMGAVTTFRSCEAWSMAAELSLLKRPDPSRNYQRDLKRF